MTGPNRKPRTPGQAPVARLAYPDDAALVSALLYEFNGEGLSPEDLRERLVELRGRETAFLGEVDGVAAGLLILRTVPTLSGLEHWAEITEMYIRPAFRRQGVGTALAEAALEHCRRHGCREIHLLVDPRNRAAHAFYQRVGFRRDSWGMRMDL